jgi:cardiolipin synthase A/B
MPSSKVPCCLWLNTGDEAFGEMLRAIGAARVSIRFETYIFAPGELGARFRTALVEARRRGVAVRVLIDAWGSLMLSDDFWIPLREAGGQCRWFNRFQLKRFGFRDHRKLLVCDDQVAFVGGYNIAPEYEGDGVQRGWRDLGIRVEHPVAKDLAASFDLLYEHAAFRHRRFARWRRLKLAYGQRWLRRLKVGRRTTPPEPVAAENSGGEPRFTVLFQGPGFAPNSFKRALRVDLNQADSVRIMTAYFLPTFRIRRELIRKARRGGRVQLLFAGHSDVKLSQWASQRLYTRLLKAGVEIYEYQPQMLHAKMVLLDARVYIGSANLDVRSLNINYELMLRMDSLEIATEAAEFFEQSKRHSRRVELREWRANRSVWTYLKEAWSYFILTRVDPYFARRQMRRMR